MSSPVPESNHNDRHREFLRAFTTHEPGVRAFVRRLVPSRSDADDILQEVSIVLWEKFDDFHTGGDFKAWACGIAQFKVLSWLRDRGRDRLVLDMDVVQLVAEDSLQCEPLLEQQRIALELCFSTIPTSQRDLLTRAYHRDVKIQDVAATSGRSIGGFYQWLHRMRKLLLECIRRELAKEPVA